MYIITDFFAGRSSRMGEVHTDGQTLWKEKEVIARKIDQGYTVSRQAKHWDVLENLVFLLEYYNYCPETIGMTEVVYRKAPYPTPRSRGGVQLMDFVDDGLRILYVADPCRDDRDVLVCPALEATISVTPYARKLIEEGKSIASYIRRRIAFQRTREQLNKRWTEVLPPNVRSTILSLPDGETPWFTKIGGGIVYKGTFLDLTWRNRTRKEVKAAEELMAELGPEGLTYLELLAMS